MQHVKVNGVEVAYEVAGRGEPILFIHGAHVADAMRPLVEDPALERFQRIRYHRRGVGGSSCPPEARATAVAVHADDAVALLEQLEVDRAHLVGHSSGGSIALEIACRHPTTCRIRLDLRTRAGHDHPRTRSGSDRRLLCPLSRAANPRTRRDARSPRCLACGDGRDRLVARR